MVWRPCELVEPRHVAKAREQRESACRERKAAWHVSRKYIVMLQRWFSRSGTNGSDDELACAIDWARSAVPVGMVQLGSMTYRILRLSDNHYGVVRLLDDKFVGHFEQRPALRVAPERAESLELLTAVAKRAIRAGRTAWVPRAALASSG